MSQPRDSVLGYARGSNAAPRKLLWVTLRSLAYSTVAFLGPIWNVAHSFQAYYWTGWPYVWIADASFALALLGSATGVYALVKASLLRTFQTHHSAERRDRAQAVWLQWLAIVAVGLGFAAVAAVIVSPSFS